MLQRLLAARGPSGYEDEVRRIILEVAKPLADEVTVDALGNVLATVRGEDPSAPTVMLDAHMDEVGLVITSVMDNGLLRYDPLGGVDPVVLVSKRVRVGKGGMAGVIGSKPVHLQKPDERKKPYTHADLFIDVGAKDKADAMTLVKAGDFVTFDTSYQEFGEGLVMSRALDDRVGCYAMLKAMERRYPCTVVYCFSVQEEVGMRGAMAASRRVKPDIGLAIEGTTAADTGSAQPYEEVCNVGAGPAISFMDRASVAYQPLMNALRQVAIEKGIPWQVKRYVSGGNNAGAMQGAGARTGVISVPCRYIHSPASVASLADIENTCALVTAFLSSGAKI